MFGYQKKECGGAGSTAPRDRSGVHEAAVDHPYQCRGASVIGKNIEARLATADNASSILALPPGSEIKVLSERGDWIYAALPNDLRGWIPAKSAERVRL